MIPDPCSQCPGFSAGVAWRKVKRWRGAGPVSPFPIKAAAARTAVAKAAAQEVTEREAVAAGRCHPFPVQPEAGLQGGAVAEQKIAAALRKGWAAG